jgi:hypothetical protein
MGGLPAWTRYLWIESYAPGHGGWAEVRGNSGRSRWASLDLLVVMLFRTERMKPTELAGCTAIDNPAVPPTTVFRPLLTRFHESGV